MKKYRILLHTLLRPIYFFFWYWRKGMKKKSIIFRNVRPRKKMFRQGKLISTGFQSTWGFACTSVLSQAPTPSRLKPFSFSRILARREKPVKKSEFLRGNYGRNFPWWSITWQRESSPLQVRSKPPLCKLLQMWVGAVNRQPGYRASNLQRRDDLLIKSICKILHIKSICK